MALGKQTVPKDVAYYSSLHQKAEEEAMAKIAEEPTVDGKSNSYIISYLYMILYYKMRV